MIEITQIEPKEIIKGCKGRFIHAERFTVGFWEIEVGAVIPLHSHKHEQTTQVTEGEFEMTINGITNLYKAGSIVVIPSNVVHGGKAITNCTITDVFCPVREDYK
ncbi:cupin domain-containing protein [Aestuariivivens sediminis]|uniref:cupin domain-containing protein n=1 Tax=Aestuariivivens sediminis TaxID=2913557 RepID=UPI001F57FC6C|nr:cupin domain-containing protein [Aestuariivivens sediminis]